MQVSKNSPVPIEIQYVQKYLIAWFIEYWAEEYKGILTGKMFGRLWEMFEYLRDNGNQKKPEFYTIATKIEDFTDIIDMTQDVYTKYDLPKYARQLFEYYISINQSKSIENLDKVKSVLDRIEYINTWSKKSTIFDVFSQVEQTIEENKWRWDEPVWYATWIQTIDKHCDGLRPWTVMRINAYSNTGKSKLSYFMVNNFLRQNKKVAYFSLEVTPDMVLLNLLANWYKEDFKSIERGKKIIDFSEYYEVCKNNLDILDPKFSDISDIERFVELNKPDIVCIDYIQNVGLKWSSSEYEKLSSIANRIQLIAISNKCAILDLSQISNEWFTYKVWGMIPSKWSWALVHAADVGIMLYQRDDQLKLAIAKNKFGQKDIETTLKFDFSKGIFEDLLPSEF